MNVAQICPEEFSYRISMINIYTIFSQVVKLYFIFVILEDYYRDFYVELM